MQNRIGSCKRKTKETDIELTINLDGQGKNQIDTGIPFFDHMLDGFARHGLFDLNVKVRGDLEVDVVLIAMGYSHPCANLAKEFKVETDKRGNIQAPTSGKNAYCTSNPKVFASGDGRKGQSLVVYAIAEGRECAKSVHEYLMSQK